MVRQEIKNFFMDYKEHKGLECTAPCSLCSVLYENKVLGDPSVSDNAARHNAYLGGECVFYAEFEIAPLVMSMKNVLLRFYGLDTLCKIEVNGHYIASTDNMHLTYDFEVKTKLNVGKNQLKLTFSPVKENHDLRKSYFSFGNHGAARLPDMGIFRKIEVVAFNHKIISDVRVKQTHTDGSVRLDLSVSTVGYDELSRTVATLTSPAGNVYFCGFVGTEGHITVTDPNLWWPNGQGMQNLYKLCVNLYSESEIEDTYEMRIGLRTVAFKEGEDGECTLVVNGCPMLAMGGEYMSEDILLSRLNRERTYALIENAKKANFNSILIHGSGYYPEKYFFDACDEQGLAVWAQLPVLPSDSQDSEQFVNALKKEISENLTRVAHHPSLCVVIGNDRVSKLFATQDELDKFTNTFSDFEGMNVFDKEGKCLDSFVRVNHASLPSYQTILRLSEPNKRNLGSDVFELHGADKDTVMDMLAKAFDSYSYANGMSELSYVLGLSSAQYSMNDVDEARRERKPLGIFMCGMNDSWPSISPSAVDYYGVEKPLHYYEQEFFLPVRISVTQKGTRMKFVVTNNSRQDYVGVFAYAIMNNTNRPVFRDSFPIRVRSGAKLDVHNVDIGSVISGHENEYYLLYSISDNTNNASKGIHLFTKPKRFNLKKPEYSIEITGNGTEYMATVGADCFALGVEVSFESENVSIGKNYFNITGKAPTRIRLTTPRMTTVEKLKRVMKIRSVYDLGHEN